MKKITTIGDYAILLDGKRVVAHDRMCIDSGQRCSLHDATATKKQLQKMLEGKLRKLQDYEVTYPSKHFAQIGCTKIKLTIVARLAKLLP